MGIENKPVYVYCVVKKAMLRKKNGEVICSIPFSNQFHVLGETYDGRLYGEAYKSNGRGYIKYRGYVNPRGFSQHRVIDMAYLKYKNKTGQKVPTAIRYKGKADGFIDRDEVVNAIAFVDGFMLTNRGWTKAEWLEKQRNIEDYEGMRTLVFAVITQTVKDYTTIIRKLQSGGRCPTGEFRDVVEEIRLIRKWFNDGDYLKIFEDDMTGQERLQCLDKELGVTEEWMKRTLSKKRCRQP